VAVVLAVLTPVCCVADEAALTVYVSPTGSDSAAGTLAHPLRTLAAARDGIRKRRAGAAGTARIVLRRGDHVTAGVEFTDEDSDGRSRSLVVESHAGERARIVNGRVVPLTSFSQVAEPDVLERLDAAARGKVLRLDLVKAGVTKPRRYPDVFSGHGGMVQLLQGHDRLPLARWPDEGYVTMGTVRDSGLEPRPHGGTFEYSGDRPARWTRAADAGGLWLMGFWRVPWTIQAVRVAEIDVEQKTITLAAAVSGGIGSKYTPLVNGTRRGDGREPWYAFNLLEEITRPGEWCVDFDHQALFLWPLTDSESVVICDSTHPAISFSGAADVRLERVDIEGGLNEAVRIEDGDRICVRGCSIRNTGAAGIRVTSGTAIEIRSCDLFDIGAEAITLDSGVRATLARGDSMIVGNHVHHTGATSRTTYAMIVQGVGNTVSNNLIHDTPMGAIGYGGNDHLLAANEIHNVGLDAGDVGAIYTNGDWASRGTVIRGNLIHHAAGVNAIYLDDGHGGDVVEGNRIYRTLSGLFLGGGHDIVCRDNLIVECPTAIHLDDRGLYRNYTIDADNALTRYLRQIDLQRDPWKSRYPDLRKLLATPAALPRPTGNSLAGNVLVDCPKAWSLPKGELVARENVLEPNLAATSAQVGLTGSETLEFVLGDEQAVRAAVPRFPLPLAGPAGLVIDRWRTRLPTAQETGRYASRTPRKIFSSQTDVDATNRNAAPR
jgi:hypothetical protein